MVASPSSTSGYDSSALVISWSPPFCLLTTLALLVKTKARTAVLTDSSRTCLQPSKLMAFTTASVWGLRPTVMTPALYGPQR